MKMKKIIVILCSCVLMLTTVVKAERQAELAAGGWRVIYGDPIDEEEYLKLAEAIVKIIREQKPEPLYDLFEEELKKNVQ